MLPIHKHIRKVRSFDLQFLVRSLVKAHQDGRLLDCVKEGLKINQMVFPMCCMMASTPYNVNIKDTTEATYHEMQCLGSSPPCFLQRNGRNIPFHNTLSLGIQFLFGFNSGVTVQFICK